MGVNDKSAEARARKQDQKSANQAAASKAKDDAYWGQHDNPRLKKDAKKEEELRKKQEAAERKAELKKLAAAEEAAMANLGKKKSAAAGGGGGGGSKVTHHQLRLQSEAERRKNQQLAAQKFTENRRDVNEDEYASQLEIENTNREGDVVVQARSVEEAVRQLQVADGVSTEGDRHPERRAKAAWESYYERELPLLKEDKPGLKMMQYKNLIFEKWQRSPENPRNQLQQQ